MNCSFFKISVIIKFVIFSFRIIFVVSADDTLSAEEILVHDVQDYGHFENSDNKVITNELKCDKIEKNEHWFSKIPLLPVIVATSKSIPEGSCKKQLHLYIENLKNGTLWATEMFDSSAKYPYGLFDGLNRHFGSYDQCQRIQTKVNYKDGKIDEIRSRYCLVDVKYKEKNEPSSITEKFSINFDPQGSAWKAIREKGDYRRYRRNFLQMALCFPAGCRPEDIVTALKDPIEKFGAQNNVQVEVAITPTYCTSTENTKISIYEKLYVISCILIISLVVITTVLDTNSIPDKKLSFSMELLSCFNARKHFNEIFTVTFKHRGLDSIHFIRALFICLTVLGHRQVLIMIGGNINGLYLEWVLSIPSFALIQNSAILIDAFLGLGGLLLSYQLLEYLDTQNKFNIGRMILRRVLRLTPLYMFITFFYATIFYHVGSGPIWEHDVGLIRDSCVSYWWTNLLFINNYVGGQNKCLIHSWYLAVDFQCYIIGLLLIAAFHKMPRKVGYVFLSCAFIFTVAITFYVTFVNNLPPIPQSLTQIRRIEESDFFVNYYVKTHLRLSAYLVGLIIGAIIYDSKFATNWRISKHWANFVCVPLIFILFFVTPAIGHFFLDPNIETSIFQRALYAAVHRPIFTLGLCFIPLFLTICDGLDFYYNLMTPRWVQPLSRISYGIYLIHFAIQQFELGSTRTPLTFSIYNAVKNFSGDIIFSMFLSLFLTIVIELPFKNLGNVFFMRNNNIKASMSVNSLKKME